LSNPAFLSSSFRSSSVTLVRRELLRTLDPLEIALYVLHVLFVQRGGLIVKPCRTSVNVYRSPARRFALVVVD
jgi:hypothetical protein